MMTTKHAVFSLLLCGCTAAVANDSTATLGAGGIEFTKNASIAMEQEDLFISTEQIRVKYIFRNNSAQDITTRVAFPVPEFPENPDGDIAMDTHSDNPLLFAVQVDDQPKTFATEVKKNDGQVKLTHHWMQTFPAGKALVVSHQYRPVVGGEAGFWFEGEERATRIKNYCIEPDLLKWIKQNHQPDKGKHLSPHFVDYILTTGANWQGAIGKFRLTLQKQTANDRVTFCGEGLQKVDAKTFVMEKTNFVPQTDLRILFLQPNLL